MSKADNFMKEVINQGKTSITQILMDIRKGMKGKFNTTNSKTNFTAKGAEMQFDFEDGIRYKITIQDIGKAKK